MEHEEKIRLIYGTGNAAKLEVMKEYLADVDGIELVGLKELPFAWEEPEENGRDPLENARQKALCYYRTCRMPVFSADSGLFIEGLPAEEQPGVHVRRVGGKTLTDAEMREYYKGIARRLGGRCAAWYMNAVCLVFSEDEIYESCSEETAREKFYLTTEERKQRMDGFPLDAISADFETGRHFYDSEDAVRQERPENSCARFFKEVLAEHEKREKRA